MECRGVVKKWSSDKGHGIISCGLDGEEVLVYRRAIGDLPDLSVGDKVLFQKVDDGKSRGRFKAEEVRRAALEPRGRFKNREARAANSELSAGQQAGQQLLQLLKQPQLQQPQPQQPQQQPQRSPALSAPPRSHAPATATRGMRSPEMRQRVKWVDMTSPSPFTDTGNTGGSGSSTHPPPWEKAAVAKPFGTREHPQTALSAGTGDEVLQKSLLANPRELHAPPPQEFTHQCWDSLLASHFQGGDAPAFSFPPAPPPPWELRLPLTERLLP